MPAAGNCRHTNRRLVNAAAEEHPQALVTVGEGGE